jgi:hypothetical protein
MTRILLVAALTIMLVGAWGSIAAAREAYSLSKAYNMDKAEQGFVEPPKGEPSASVVAADAVLGRTLGLATTIVGTGVFIITLPMSVPSGSVDSAAWGLIGRPGGWTFDRPLGRGKPEYEERSIFR